MNRVVSTDIERVLTLRRPVGAWRFLTPLDKIRVGDLYRFVWRTEDPRNNFETAFLYGWTEVAKETGIVGLLMLALLKLHVEVIRAVDESGTHIPLFDGHNQIPEQ